MRIKACAQIIVNLVISRSFRKSFTYYTIFETVPCNEYLASTRPARITHQQIPRVHSSAKRQEDSPLLATSLRDLVGQMACRHSDSRRVLDRVETAVCGESANRQGKGTSIGSLSKEDADGCLNSKFTTGFLTVHVVVVVVVVEEHVPLACPRERSARPCRPTCTTSTKRRSELR